MKTRATHPEDIRCCAFVGGFQSYEGDAVVQRRVAQHTRPKYGVFWDVTCRVDACKNVRQTLLDRFGIPIPHQLLRAGLLHFKLQRQRTETRQRDGGKHNTTIAQKNQPAFKMINTSFC